MSFYTSVQDQNFLAYWQPLIAEGKYVLSPKDGKIWTTQAYTGIASVDTNRTWVYVHNNPFGFCDWYHDIVATFGFIPTNCMENCWKVVVRPATIVQLLQLYRLQVAMAADDDTCFCKLGIEKRAHVFGNYGGYFYSPSLKAGLDRLDQVREAVAKEIFPDIQVNLKRGCTEFEMRFGPSTEYKRDEAYAQRVEKQIKEHCVMTPFHDKQPELMVLKTIQQWLNFAWDRGDPTVYALTDNNPIYPMCVHYEREKENGPETKKAVKQNPSLQSIKGRGRPALTS